MRRFFWAPKTYAKIMGKNINNLMLEIFVCLNLWILLCTYLLYLELVISASVVEIMAQTTHYQGKGFQITHEIFNMTILKI